MSHQHDLITEMLLLKLLIYMATLCAMDSAKLIKQLLGQQMMEIGEHVTEDELQSHMILMKVIIKSHFVACKDVECLCHQKRMRLYLIQQQMKSKNSTYQAIYNLQKFHDCRYCQIGDCFQQYILRKIADQEVHQRQIINDDIQKYQQIITYEIYLKGYLEVLNKISVDVGEFWALVQKNEIDIYKSQIIGEGIIQKYQRFQSIYENFAKSGSDNIQIESLAWKLNQEILQFEQEAQQNLERIKTSSNKRRVEIKLSNNNEVFVESKIHLLVISANPQNFQKIMNFSKSFSKFSGYADDFLLRNKVTLVLPKILDEQHEKIIKKYLKRRKELDNNKITLSQSWLKKPNGTLVPVQISVISKIDVDLGLQMIGLIQKVKKINLFDQNIPSTDIYCILTDVNNRIIHVSENCSNNINFPADVTLYDIFISNIIKGLPDQIENNSDLELLMDTSDLQTYQNNSNLSILQFKIKLSYKEYNYGKDNVLREYLFVILAPHDVNGTESLKLNSLLQNQNFQIVQFSEDQQNQNQEGQNEQIDETESELFQIQSMSSTSSGSSNVSNQDAQVCDIKNVLDFKSFPQSLRSYRIKLIASFIMLLVTAIVLLVVNIQSKNQYEADIQTLKTEKNVRNAFSSSKLSLIYLYTTSNAPSYFDQQRLSAPLNNVSLDPFFRQKLISLTGELHQSLNEFSQKQALWDKDFVYKVNKEDLKAKKITFYGNQQEVDSTFFKSITLFVDYCDFISNTYSDDLKIQDDIFKYNNADELASLLKKIKDPLNTIIQYVFFCIFNGSDVLLRQMLKIDESFIMLIQNHGNDLIRVILIFTICCCCVTAIISFLQIPYYFAIETAQKFTVEFLYLTDKQLIKQYFTRIKDFQIQLINNGSDGDDEKKKSMAQVSLNKSLTNKRRIAIHGFTVNNEEEFKTQDIKPLENTQIYSSIQQFQTKNNLFERSQPVFIENEPDVKDLNLKYKHTQNQAYLPKKFQKKQLSQKLNALLEDSSNENEGQDQNPGEQTVNLSDLNQTHLSLNSLNDQDYDIKLLQSQTNRKKIIIIIIFFLIGAFIATFYIVTYVMSRTILNDFSIGFYQYDVFFTRVTCLTESLFFTQKSILFNDTMGDDTFNGKQLSLVLNECSTNEQKYREIKKDSSGMFQGLSKELEQLDSPKFCQFQQSKGEMGPECQKEVDGFLNLGLEQMISAMLNHIQQKRITFISVPRINRTEALLSKTFFEKDTLQYVMIYYQYLEKVFYYIQNTAHQRLSDQMSVNFNAIVSVFIVYILLVIFLAILAIFRLVDNLRLKLLKIRMLLKLMPSIEIYKNKDKLEKLDTKLL
ncbi:UNKNOWN [Stylonychia lemnae]|uniref:Pas domain s-box family protein n=1 Tax=Stylonychia lemnae TaxID=5949 RepID=A0A077ZYV5_STYLE|nr:UNKNOWN [Stylonychia lemnae]|eukprot:CDW74797.1 UNKNOWN [Stylonychia lemnae]